MRCAIKVAGFAGRLLALGSLLFTVSLVAQEPPADDGAAAQREPTSVDELTAPLPLENAPDWTQPYTFLLDTDQNNVLTAPELDAWKARGQEVMTVIPPSPLPGETFTGPVAIPEIVNGVPDLQWQPNYLAETDTLLAKAQSIIFRRDIWCFEFSFRPLRMIEIDIPSPNGRMERKPVWYMVYRIRYLGNDLTPEPRTDEYGNTTFPTTTSTARNSRRFFPKFVLESFEFEKAYMDRIIPAARDAIAFRERPPAMLYNSAEIMNVPIPLGTPDSAGVWGYVTWTDIDPRIDFFSIYVTGLTNAFKYEDTPEGFKQGDPLLTGRNFQSKTLRLNFWRPGDSVAAHEDEIRYGVPTDADPVRQAELLMEYGLTERLDYLWEYR